MDGATLKSIRESPTRAGRAASTKAFTTLKEHIIEVISDSGEGAQRCGQSLGAIAARMGNGVWTVEIIPAEIRPPARSVAGASGNRIRIGSGRIQNGGDEADLVIAFNEQVLLGRLRAGELKSGCILLMENMWREHPDPKIAASYVDTHRKLVDSGYRVIEIPMERECRAIVSDAKRGKNMFALGMLCNLYSFDLQLARDQIALTFGKKDQSVIAQNVKLLEAGFNWAEANLDFKYAIPAVRAKEPQIVVNGNTALALGVLASGMEICAMYPITPATSASHYLSEVFEKVGGVVHQAEDEIAACAFAIGASYAGKCAVTITSGPGFSLKQEALGLAVMGEIPLVVVNVQRGGPSTGQPTKAEQGDLFAAMFGSHGDAPKVVMAPATIEDCFYSIITARRIAETFNMVVVVLSDAALATSQQPFPRPQFNEAWIAPPVDQSAVPDGMKPYDWDAATGLAHRFIPRTARRHAHADRPCARSRQPRRLRSRQQRGEHPLPQPEARRAAEDAEDAARVRRCQGRSARDRLGQHQGRDRGGRTVSARRRAQGLLDTFPVPAAAARRHQGNHAGLQAGDDYRRQLGRSSGRRDHRREQPPPHRARDAAALALSRRCRLLERSARPADQAGRDPARSHRQAQEELAGNANANLSRRHEDAKKSEGWFFVVLRAFVSSW